MSVGMVREGRPSAGRGPVVAGLAVLDIAGIAAVAAHTHNYLEDKWEPFGSVVSLGNKFRMTVR